jgi:predicted dehydrogenase
VRLALLGCGEVARAKHLPALKRIAEVQVVAVCDIDRDRCQAVAQQFAIPRQTTAAAYVFAMGDVDAVGILTNPGSHEVLALAAMKAGKAVYVEKPLALTVAECERLVAEAERTRMPAMTGFHMRFHRLVVEAHEKLRQGAIGAVQSVRVVWHSPRGDRNIAAWKTRREEGGGALIEIGVHHLDLVRFLLGGEFEAVRAMSRDGVRHDESSVSTARLTDGTLVSGEFSERSPHEIEIVVSGLSGILRLDCLKFDGLEIRASNEVPGAPALRLRSVKRFAGSLPDGIKTMRRGGDYLISYENAWRHFVDCVRSGATPACTFEDGLRAVEVVRAAVESAATGESIRVGSLG